MLECIEKLKQHGILVRWSGGYWTREGCPTKKIFEEIPIPEWYFTWGTINSLISRGILYVSEENFDKYNQTYYPVAVKLKQ